MKTKNATLSAAGNNLYSCVENVSKGCRAPFFLERQVMVMTPMDGIFER